MEKVVELSDGFTAEKEGNVLTILYGEKELRRILPRRNLNVTVVENKITISSNKAYRALVGTFASHFKNMIAGLKRPFVYKLKICSSHFPMNVKLEDNKLSIHNFMGSSAPKIVKLTKGVDVSINGDIIIVKSADIELAGKTASNMEQATRLNNKDRRVFQDGVFITQKAGQEENDD